MAAYIRLESKERARVKGEILNVKNKIQKFHETSQDIVRLKKKKKATMIGLIKSIKVIDEDLSKIKEKLPKIIQGQKPKKVMLRKRPILRKINISQKINYEEELRKIQEKLATI
jgi:hypothetical protein